MSQTAIKKNKPAISKVVKLPGKKRKIVDPFGANLKKEIDSRGVTVARMARDAGVNRSNVYKWIKGHVPGYDDRVKVETWMHGDNANSLQKQLKLLHAENKALIHQVAKIMSKGSGQTIAEAMASLKADIEIHLNDKP